MRERLAALSEGGFTMRRLLLVPVLAIACMGLLAAPALASPKTFYVHPSGGNDTHNIQEAFNAAVAAGPGSTVQLSAGHFYTNTILVKNFDGYVKGAGEGQTVIDTARGIDPSAPVVTPVTVYPGDQLVFLFGFKGGDVRVSDMSLDITPFSPAAPWNQATETDLSTVLFVTGNASSAFDQVSFQAHAGDNDDGYNVRYDILVEGTELVDSNDNTVYIGPTGGTHTVSRCSFAGDYGIALEGLTAGRATITDSVFDDYVGGIFSIEASNSEIDVSHNRMQCSSWANVILYQGFVEVPPLPAPRYVISDNDMTANGTADAVYMEDDSLPYWGVPDRLHAVLAGNTIYLDNGGNGSGIAGAYTQGTQVLYNHIAGTGYAGIEVGTTADFGAPSSPASDWLIIGNDVSGVNPVSAFGMPAAPIWLGLDASHCLVVGGKAPTQVLDEGTDDTLINVTPVFDPPAAAATPMHALRQMKLLKGMAVR